MKSREEMKTDFERLDAMTDDDIDCSDIPALTDEELESMEWFAEGPDRESIYFSVDRSVLEYFRMLDKNYRERMNAVLKDYVMTMKKAV